jgi:hypothetical protein
MCLAETFTSFSAWVHCAQRFSSLAVRSVANGVSVSDCNRSADRERGGGVPSCRLSRSALTTRRLGVTSVLVWAVYRPAFYAGWLPGWELKRLTEKDTALRSHSMSSSTACSQQTPRPAN